MLKTGDADSPNHFKTNTISALSRWICVFLSPASDLGADESRRAVHQLPFLVLNVRLIDDGLSRIVLQRLTATWRKQTVTLMDDWWCKVKSHFKQVLRFYAIFAFCLSVITLYYPIFQPLHWSWVKQTIMSRLGLPKVQHHFTVHQYWLSVEPAKPFHLSLSLFARFSLNLLLLFISPQDQS